MSSHSDFLVTLRMAQALGVTGLQGLKQSLSGEIALDRLQHSQDGSGACCFRPVSLPPIVAISLTSSSEDLVAVKKGKKKGALRTRKVVESSSVRDHHQTAARALSVLHERFSTALYHNIALTEDELSRYSIMSPDASTILGQSILEAQWALTLEELMREENKKERKVTRKAGSKGNLKEVERKKDSTLEEAVEDTCTESTSSTTIELVVKSGRPSARTRRLEARQKRVAAAGKPTNPEVLMIHPLKKYQKGERAKPVKTEGVQDYLTTYLREITKIDLLTKQEEIVLSKKFRIGLNLIEERKK